MDRILNGSPERVSMPPSEAWLSHRLVSVVRKTLLVLPIRDRLGFAHLGIGGDQHVAVGRVGVRHGVPRVGRKREAIAGLVLSARVSDFTL